MKPFSDDFRAAIAGPVTTLAWCWRLERADGLVLGCTDHDRTLSFGGVDYLAASGFTGSEIPASLGLAVATQDVEGALAADAITEDDIRAGLYDGARVEIWRVDWTDAARRALVRAGTIGEIRRAGIAFTAELRGLAQALDAPAGRSYQRQCDAGLGDHRCGVDLGQPGLNASGTVAAVSEDRLLRLEAFEEGSFADGWFRHGRLAWTSGANSGLAGGIRAHRQGPGGIDIELWLRAARPVAPGDGFTVTAGCDKAFATCRAKFANGANYRGFPHMPGNDRAFSYVVGQSGENDGGSFFN